MTDFLRVNVVMIGADDSIVEANARMISRGVRLLMVSGADDAVLGLDHRPRHPGRKAVATRPARGCKRDDLQVADLMTPIGNVDTLYLNEVLHVRVIDILDALKHLGRQHILVEDVDPRPACRVRGMFSATHIGRLLGVPVLGFELASTLPKSRRRWPTDCCRAVSCSASLLRGAGFILEFPCLPLHPIAASLPGSDTGKVVPPATRCA
jgi:hypothetical protein